MALHKTTGIVLHHIKYGDTSIITTIYTEKFGRQAYIIKGARSRKARLKANLFQPLFLLDMEVYYKANRELNTIKEAKNSRPFLDIPFNFTKTPVCLFLAEILYKTLKEEEQNQKLFDFITSSIFYFDEQKNFPANFHLTFLLHLSRFLGFYPNDNYSESNSYFDLKEGYFADLKPVHNHYLPKIASYDFHVLLNTDFSDNVKFSTVEMRQYLLDKILEFYTYHQERMGDIKSLEILREIFK
ncbi:MAG: DNA repair protein RecO [Bacteroidota bacterium]|nr:DNA repair protein RecO [Bacteroidota bacterium]